MTIFLWYFIMSEPVRRLLSYRLTVLKQLILVAGVCVGIFVARLLVGLLHIVPGFLHPDLQEFGIVGCMTPIQLRHQ